MAGKSVGERDDDEYSAVRASKFCTFAATGAHPTFQGVFICHTCGTNSDVAENMPLCICEGCAECCHEDLGHDVEYVGIGPSYCDCSSIARSGNRTLGDRVGCDCILQDVSKEAALKLGIMPRLDTHKNAGTDIDTDTNTDTDPVSKHINKNSCINISLPSKYSHIGTDSNINHLDQQDQGVDSWPEVQLGPGPGPDTDTRQKGDFPFEYQVFSIESLATHQNHKQSSQPKPKQQCGNNTGAIMNTSHRLIQQALELIQHTTDTHWIPFQRSQDGKVLPTNKDDACDLEHLASSIFQKHVQTYNLQQHIVQGHSGAEWWVQVKHVYDYSCTSSSDEQQQKYQQKNETAIDLHYDKDEELASVFDLASFPTLSTVTYLTGNAIPSPIEPLKMTLVAPTLVFAHTYNMQDNGPIGGLDTHDGQPADKTPQILISHARAGKHLVFDGRCLHGAPSNQQLRKKMKDETNGGSHLHHDDAAKGKDILEEHHRHHGGLRVTFLVNIWLSRRPSQVVALPEDIRAKVVSCVEDKPVDSCTHFSTRQFVQNREGVTSLYVDAQNNLSKSCEKIHLPFVSSGATWIDDVDGGNEDGEVGLVVSMFPPPSYATDTAIVCYGAGDGPRLEYVGNEYDTDPDTDPDVCNDKISVTLECTG